MQETRRRESKRGDASLTSRFRRGGWWFGRARGSGVTFDVVGVPGEEALEAVFQVCGRGEAVVFARIDDEFGGAAEAFERLVHLFTTNDGNVPINVAAHEKRGRGDVVHTVERR